MENQKETKTRLLIDIALDENGDGEINCQYYGEAIDYVEALAQAMEKDSHLAKCVITAAGKYSLDLADNAAPEKEDEK